MAAYDASLPGIVMMGGDSVLHPKRTPRYLNDLWYLSTNVSFPSWHLSAGNDSADGAGADQGWAEEVFDEELEDGDEVAKHHKLTAGEAACLYQAITQASSNALSKIQLDAHALCIARGLTQAGLSQQLVLLVKTQSAPASVLLASWVWSWQSR